MTSFVDKFLEIYSHWSEPAQLVFAVISLAVVAGLIVLTGLWLRDLFLRIGHGVCILSKGWPTPALKSPDASEAVPPPASSPATPVPAPPVVEPMPPIIVAPPIVAVSRNETMTCANGMTPDSPAVREAVDALTVRSPVLVEGVRHEPL